jgi:hypothetical protein
VFVRVNLDLRVVRNFILPSLGSKIVRYMIDSGALISYLRLLSSSTD